MSLPTHNFSPVRARRRRAAARQKGYTLVEIGIIAMFLALLTLFSVQQISTRVGDLTRADAVYTSSRKLSEWWNMVWQYCSFSPDALTTSAVGNGSSGSIAKDNMSLAAGKVPVFASYAGCYKNTGLKPLSSVMIGQAGSMKFLTYPLSWSYVNVNGRHAVMVSFDNVPDDVLLPLYRKYSRATGATSTFSLATSASDTSDTVIRFTTATTAGRTVSVIHPL